MTDDPSTSPRETRPAITVPGLGTVLVEPDVADLRLGVVSTRPTAGAARAVAAETMRAVLDALASSGVERRDVRTTLVGLDAVRDYGSGGTPTITGHQLTNTVSATIRATGTVGSVIDAALAAGATSLDGLTFRQADPTEALAEARRLAVVDARARATTLAREAQVHLGRVVAIVEGAPIGPGLLPGVLFRARAAIDPSTPVEAGTSELTIAVTVTFEIA